MTEPATSPVADANVSLADMLDPAYEPTGQTVSGEVGDAQTGEPGDDNSNADAVFAPPPAAQTDDNQDAEPVAPAEPEAPTEPPSNDDVEALKRQLDEEKAAREAAEKAANDARLTALEQRTQEPAQPKELHPDVREMSRLLDLSPEELGRELAAEQRIVQNDDGSQSIEGGFDAKKLDLYIRAKALEATHGVLQDTFGDNYNSVGQRVAADVQSVQIVEDMIKADDGLAPFRDTLNTWATNAKTKAAFSQQIEGMTPSAAARYMRLQLVQLAENANAVPAPAAASATAEGDTPAAPETPAAETVADAAQAAGVASTGRAGGPPPATGGDADDFEKMLSDDVERLATRLARR